MAKKLKLDSKCSTFYIINLTLIMIFLKLSLFYICHKKIFVVNNFFYIEKNNGIIFQVDILYLNSNLGRPWLMTNFKLDDDVFLVNYMNSLMINKSIPTFIREWNSNDFYC